MSYFNVDGSVASATDLGVVKIGSGLTITPDGTISAPSTSLSIQTVAVQGDGSFTAALGSNTVTFAPGGRIVMSITGSTVTITDNAKAHKVKKVKHKDNTFEADIVAIAPEDTMTFIDGAGIKMATDAVNETITISNRFTTRNVGSATAVTIDFSTDEVVVYNQGGSASTISFANYTAGSRVRVIVLTTGTKNITHGVPGTQSSSATTTFTPVANSAIQLEYFCTTTDINGVYVTVHKV